MLYSSASSFSEAHITLSYGKGLPTVPVPRRTRSLTTELAVGYRPAPGPEKEAVPMFCKKGKKEKQDAMNEANDTTLLTTDTIILRWFKSRRGGNPSIYVVQHNGW